MKEGASNEDLAVDEQQEAANPAELTPTTKRRRRATTSNSSDKETASSTPSRKKSKTSDLGEAKGPPTNRRKNRGSTNSTMEMNSSAAQESQESTTSSTPLSRKGSDGGDFHRRTTIDELSPNDGVSPTVGGSPNLDGDLGPQVYKFSGKWVGFRFFTKEVIKAKVHWADGDGITPGGHFICNGSRESCPKCAIGEQPQDRCAIPAYWVRGHQVVLIEFNPLGKNNKITPIHRIIRDALKHIDDPAYVMRIRKPDDFTFEGWPGHLKNKNDSMEDAIQEFEGWWAENAGSIRIAPKLSWDEILERFPTVAEELDMHEETTLDECDEDLIEDLDELEDEGDEG